MGLMTMHSLDLTKGEHKYLFRYAPGSEENVIAELMRLTEDTNNEVDWLDAATLSFQVTHKLAADCCKTLCHFHGAKQ
ncbi:MAG: hypothetical protein ACYSTL_00545 [Planctomycetota bacterium]|jgi:hypothetical protein